MNRIPQEAKSEEAREGGLTPPDGTSVAARARNGGSKYYKRPRIRLHANAGWFKGEERKRKLVAAVYDYRLNKVIKQLHRRLR